MSTWIDELPADIADTISDEDKPLAAKYDSLAAYFKGATNAQSRLGSSIRVPGPDAPAEDVTAYHEKLINLDSALMFKPDFAEADQSETFYRSIGKPEAADKYEVPEGVNLPTEIMAEMREIGLEANMTAAQFKKWATGMSERSDATTTQMTEQTEKAIGELKGEWGMTFDERTNAARKVNEEYYPGRNFETLTPAERKSLYNVHVSLTGKGAQMPNQDATHSAAITPEETSQRVDEMMRKAHDRSNDLSNEERKKLVMRSIDLNKKYNPKYAETG